MSASSITYVCLLFKKSLMITLCNLSGLERCTPRVATYQDDIIAPLHLEAAFAEIFQAPNTQAYSNLTPLNRTLCPETEVCFNFRQFLLILSIQCAQSYYASVLFSDIQTK